MSRNVLKSVPFAVPSSELFFSQMKLFFYNRTSLSNVIIRKYFVCDISLDSIPQSCKSIFSNSPRKQLLLYFLVRQQATARQSNTWSSSSNMSDPDDSNIWILRIQTALSRWGARGNFFFKSSKNGTFWAELRRVKMACTFLPNSAQFFCFKNWCKITSQKKVPWHRRGPGRSR